MTKQEIIEILRERTARAILNYCVHKNGSTAYINKDKSLFLNYAELYSFLINELEPEARSNEEPEQAEILIIDCYCALLGDNFTGENVNLYAVTLSELGIKYIEEYFNKVIDNLISEGVPYDY
ncbi:hypothetical protein DES39_1884 [Orbus hercynius]|uniref:Uncharacterized protein n=1 Tax=Orbus hercynius TaxID=593135 RepID=A0A495RB12_9GAMM|nr:hypothetical protein [Orbus hercynius]RKS84672.1 hypothetical protein DES39_1884 [Orbus hercynius]